MTRPLGAALGATTFAAVTATSGTALAAAGARGEWSFPIEGWYIVDFVIFVAVLVWFARRPAKSFLKARHDRIRAEVLEAERLQARAQAELDEYRALLAGLDAEIAQITADFEADGQRERERIAAEAQAQVERIERNAGRALGQETAKARETLEQLLVTSTLEQAEARIKAQLSAAKQRDMFSRYIEDLEGLDDLSRYAA